MLCSRERAGVSEIERERKKEKEKKNEEWNVENTAGPQTPV